MMFLAPELQRDSEIALTAVKQNKDSIRQVVGGARKDKELIFAAIKQSPLSLVSFELATEKRRAERRWKWRWWSGMDSTCTLRAARSS